MKVTPIKVAIHTDEENAIFGEGVVYVEIDDDAAGGYIRITENKIFGDQKEGVSCYEDQLRLVYEEAIKLLKIYRENGNEE